MFSHHLPSVSVSAIIFSLYDTSHIGLDWPSTASFYHSHLFKGPTCTYSHFRKLLRVSTAACGYGGLGTTQPITPTMLSSLHFLERALPKSSAILVVSVTRLRLFFLPLAGPFIACDLWLTWSSLNCHSPFLPRPLSCQHPCHTSACSVLGSQALRPQLVPHILRIPRALLSPPLLLFQGWGPVATCIQVTLSGQMDCLLRHLMPALL